MRTTTQIKKFILLAGVLTIGSIAGAGHGFATQQTPAATPAPTAAPAPVVTQPVAPATTAPVPFVPETPKPEMVKTQRVVDPNNPDAPYVKLDYRTFMQIMWRFDRFQATDKEAVKEYLRNTECQLYLDHIDDDFSWLSVSKATAAYLDKYKSKFPTQLTIVQPIGLERFNPEKGWFALTGDTQYLNVTQIEFANFNGMLFNCGDDPRPRLMPFSAFLKLAAPFSLTYLPMQEQFARDFITYRNANKSTIQIGSKTYDRFAFVKFYISLREMEAITPDQKTSSPAYFVGTIDSINVYADRALTLLLFRWKRDPNL